MFGLGFSEILILGVIAFLVFGPVEFPKVARSFIKVFNELRRDWTKVKTELYNVRDEAEQSMRQVTGQIQEDWQKDIKKSVLKTQDPLEKPDKKQTKPHSSKKETPKDFKS